MNKYGIEKRMSKQGLSRGEKLRFKFAAKRAQTFDAMVNGRRSNASPAIIQVSRLSRTSTMAPAKKKS